MFPKSTEEEKKRRRKKKQLNWKWWYVCLSHGAQHDRSPGQRMHSTADSDLCKTCYGAIAGVLVSEWAHIARRMDIVLSFIFSKLFTKLKWLFIFDSVSILCFFTITHSGHLYCCRIFAAIVTMAVWCRCRLFGRQIDSFVFCFTIFLLTLSKNEKKKKNTTENIVSSSFRLARWQCSAYDVRCVHVWIGWESADNT